MSKVLIVVDREQDWAAYYPSEHVISFQDYLELSTGTERVRVINLCSDYRYLSPGYYCSLLAEARGHHVLPPSKVLNDVSSPLLYQLNLNDMFETLNRIFRNQPVPERLHIKSYFGQVSEPLLQPLARLLFERFPCPVLCLQLGYQDRQWHIMDLDLLDHKSLTDDEQSEFGEALDHFSKRIWRQPKARRSARYDLAMLVNSEESLPPSNAAALKKFIKAGKNLGINVEQISPADFMRLPEFDALFIRETTAIQHHTYRFAKKAEAAGMVVIDDPTSILRCTNKVYLASLFNANKVPAPRTLMLQRDSRESLEQAVAVLDFPMVVKIPDGSFSRGVAKVNDEAELVQKCRELFVDSSVLLAQEFLYTDFDWRVGVLNNRPLYACRYYMVRNHWQIYHHHDNKKTESGGFDTLPTFEVPKVVLQAVLKATRLIGDGFYGVDVKESGGKAYVIEVNDNPNVDTGIEDRYLGNELYSLVMQEFLRRLEE